jgi:hypothetical protein
VKALPDGVVRSQQELGLQVALGQALVAAKGLAAPEVGEALGRARQLLCEELNQPTQLRLIQYGGSFILSEGSWIAQSTALRSCASSAKDKPTRC